MYMYVYVNKCHGEKADLKTTCLSPIYDLVSEYIS